MTTKQVDVRTLTEQQLDEREHRAHGGGAGMALEEPEHAARALTLGTLERAIAIAAEAHAGQLDKAGAPYITHPLRIMLAMTTPAERIVAVLHDVVEDCPAWTLERLRSEGFPEHIIAAVDAISQRPGEDHETYWRRAAADPIARRVKLADIHDNSDLSRIATPTEKDHDRIAKYRRAIDLINQLSA